MHKFSLLIAIHFFHVSTENLVTNQDSTLLSLMIFVILVTNIDKLCIDILRRTFLVIICNTQKMKEKQTDFRVSHESGIDTQIKLGGEQESFCRLIFAASALMNEALNMTLLAGKLLVLVRLI